MMTKVFCILVCVAAILEMIPAQTTPSDNSKLVAFSTCEFCSPLLTGICCKLGRGCCPEYNKCRANLVCRTKTTCDLNNCEFGCCKFDDGMCCSLGSAGLFLAPMLGAVSLSSTSAASAVSVTTPSPAVSAVSGTTPTSAASAVSVTTPSPAVSAVSGTTPTPAASTISVTTPSPAASVTTPSPAASTISVTTPTP